MRAAIYARVSSERQARQETIASQLSELRSRVAQDRLREPAEEFVDDGVTGTTLARPALDRLRDVIADGQVDRVYVHAPDRLARKYAYQVLLVEEFERHGVEVQFIHGSIGDSPEAALLQGVQGVIAEYERARLLERTRRGRLFRARAGQVSTLSQAPYGYLYERVGGRAAYVPLEPEAGVVRKIFRLIGEEQRTLRSVAAQMAAEGHATRRGGRWTAATILGIVRNTAYKGEAHFGKTQNAPGGSRLRPLLGKPAKVPVPPRQARPESEHIVIPVPALVSAAAFEAASDQLVRARTLSRRNAAPRRYLLQGLVRCGQCSHAYCGCISRAGKGRKTAHYRCSLRTRGPGASCASPGVRAEVLDAFVWEAVAALLADPSRLMQEWSTRTEADGVRVDLKARHDAAARALHDAERVVQRLVDAYEAGVLDLDGLRDRTERARKRIKAAKIALDDAATTLRDNVEFTSLVTSVQRFGERVRDGLEAADFDVRQPIIRAVVREIVVDAETVRIVYQVPRPASAPPGDPGTPGGKARLCSGRHPPAKGEPGRDRWRSRSENAGSSVAGSGAFAMDSTFRGG